MSVLARLSEKRQQALLRRLQPGDALQVAGGPTVHLQRKLGYHFPTMQLEGWQGNDERGLPVLVCYSLQPGHRQIAVSRPVSGSQLEAWQVAPEQLVNGRDHLELKQASAIVAYRRALSDVPAQRVSGSESASFFYQLWAEEEGESTLEVELDAKRRRLLCYRTVYSDLMQVRAAEARTKLPVRLQFEEQYIALPEPAPPAPPVPQALPPQRGNALALSNHMSLPVGLTGRLIGESERSGMSMQQMMRKVLDLPPEQGPDLLVPLPLSQPEREMLARRYGVEPGNWPALQAKIREELQQFIGGE